MKNITYIKSPINWVGNKFKYLDIINNLIQNKQYSMVVDLFMGSGNVILNLDCKAKKYIGNDKNKLVPTLYKKIPQYTYTLENLENILNQNNRFSTKESYYTFRDYWNKKYLTDNFDKEFIIETMLLLKMCSNSMVRFNPKEGYFNQGFRGLGNKKEFFTNTMKDIIIDGLNQLVVHIRNKNFIFTNYDFLEYKDDNNDRLLLLDPPYILRKDMYDTDFTEKHDEQLLELISNTKNNFIYFNYLYRDGVINEKLSNVIEHKNFKLIDINNKTLAGQGRSENIKEVQEVIVTNV